MRKSKPLSECRVFFLGAGFSAAANIPLTERLLPIALNLFQQECPGVYERVRNYALDLDLDPEAPLNASDFSEFSTYLDFAELREYGGGERFSREGSRERLALKFFLSKAIALATPPPTEIPSLYLDFASDLEPGDAIYTFNWDCLIENALTTLGKEFSYNFEDGKIGISKQHGSVNWIETPDGNKKIGDDFLNYKPLGFSEYILGNEIHSSDALMRADAWGRYQALHPVLRPMIVLPGYGKAADTRLLSCLWYRPEFLNVYRGGISIVGVGLAEDDYFLQGWFRYLFRAALADELGVTVLNPDANALTKFENIAGTKRKLNLVESKFDKGTLPKVLLKQHGSRDH